MIALIDGDLVCYRSAASCEPTKAKAYQEPLEIAVLRCDDMMQRILDETGVTEYKAFISGPENFRYAIDPNYKANRKDKPRPEWLQPIREHLVTRWGAHVSNGIEADDNLGIEQVIDPEMYRTVICSLDKDLLQVPGLHYNWVKQEWQEIDEHQGCVNFYTQLLLGDRSDNIPGYDGRMRQTIPQFLQNFVDALQSAATPKDMYKIMYDLYDTGGMGVERMHKNCQLLYIQRKEGDIYTVPS